MLLILQAARVLANHTGKQQLIAFAPMISFGVVMPLEFG
jgi:hypothetical protein